MALFNCNFYSRYLGYDTQVNVILPENREPNYFDEEKNYKFQVIYLLHGRGDDCNGWIRGTAIERYALKHRAAVIMPTAEDSFYLNGASGKQFFSYMTEELPQKMKKWFPLSADVEDTFIAGLSMGGYGALKIGLTYPERFAGIGILSAVTMPEYLLDGPLNESEAEIIVDNIHAVFGKDRFKEEDLPLNLVKKCIEKGKKIPPIIQYEGKQDILYDMNRKFYEQVKGKNIDITYEEWDGMHDWEFWDLAAEKMLNTFQLKNEVLFD